MTSRDVPVSSLDARLASSPIVVSLALSLKLRLSSPEAEKMGKRKLRSCTGCGGRHGPPTGKNCAQSEEIKRREEGAAAAEPKLEAAAMLAESDEEVAEALGPDCGADGHETDEDVLDLTLSTDECALPGVLEGTDRPSSPAGSGAMGARFLRQQMSALQRDRKEFEKNVDIRMLHMENVLGRVAGVQQAQLQRLIDITTASAAKENQREDPKPKPEEEVRSEGAEKAGPLATPVQSTELKSVSLKDFSDITVPDSDLEWKEYHGFAAWHLENEKKKKNPFDHQAFVKKGEKVSSFEDLMLITFKTMSKLLEIKSDVKGVVSHGQFMSDKASKNVFVDEAFVDYDQDVRNRAGEAGPSAFGTVLQEEVFTHFCLENTKKHRALNKSTTKQAKGKSDKICLRYNDAGCVSKSCAYAHKCLSCEGWGHAKKNCGNADKKKEAK